MPRETETYRDCLERLNTIAPNKDAFKPSELARLIGVDRRTVIKMFEFTDGYIYKVNAARALSKMGGAR